MRNAAPTRLPCPVVVPDPVIHRLVTWLRVRGLVGETTLRPWNALGRATPIDMGDVAVVLCEAAGSTHERIGRTAARMLALLMVGDVAALTLILDAEDVATAGRGMRAIRGGDVGHVFAFTADDPDDDSDVDSCDAER